jgi:hypothetical protein
MTLQHFAKLVELPFDESALSVFAKFFLHPFRQGISVGGNKKQQRFLRGTPKRDSRGEKAADANV